MCRPMPDVPDPLYLRVRARIVHVGAIGRSSLGQIQAAVESRSSRPRPPLTNPNSCLGRPRVEPASRKAGTARREGSTRIRELPVVVGIDVAKARLDLAVRPRGEQRQGSHDASGIAEGVTYLQEGAPQVILVGAPGREPRPV